MPELQFVGTRVTGTVAGADIAETNWKLYKSFNTKARNRLGKVSNEAFTADPDEVDVDQTTGTKLAYVASNLHAENFDDYCMSDAAKGLVAFTADDEAHLAKIFGGIFDDNEPVTNAKYFKAYIEQWERDTNKKNDTLNAKLRDKYKGMLLRDCPEEDPADLEEAEEEYFGKIIEIEYKKKKDGGYSKGYYIQTAQILDDGSNDNTEDALRLYPIDASLAGLILPRDNPSFTFRVA
jgi:hypothetical protein